MLHPRTEQDESPFFFPLQCWSFCKKLCIPVFPMISDKDNTNKNYLTKFRFDISTKHFLITSTSMLRLTKFVTLSKPSLHFVTKSKRLHFKALSLQPCKQFSSQKVVNFNPHSANCTLTYCNTSLVGKTIHPLPNSLPKREFSVSYFT